MDPRPSALAPERALPPGTLLQRFEIGHVLAETASGIDYLATDLQHDTAVVVKEYFPQRLARRVRVEMVPREAVDSSPLALGLQAFLTEAHLLARVDHPSLVHVSQVIEAHGTAYQVLPRHEGAVTLLDVRPEMRSPPDERSVRALIDGLLGALQALHEDGVVHGGVTPANVLLLANDHPLLLGPDLARAGTTNELIESLMASVEPAFGAPEQRAPAIDKPLGPWTDLYGVAATMRFFIGGELPPAIHEWPPEGAHEPMADMVQRICTGPDAPRYTAALLNALDAALGHVPGARPRSVAAFRGALGTLPQRNKRRAAQPAAAPTSAFASASPTAAAAAAATTKATASVAPPASTLPPPAARPSSPPLVFDSIPGVMASRFIEPDPEPADGDIDHIIARSGLRTDERNRPFMPRRNARWIGAMFVLAFAAIGFGGWWALRDAPLVWPPTSAGPGTPATATTATTQPPTDTPAVPGPSTASTPPPLPEFNPAPAAAAPTAPTLRSATPAPTAAELPSTPAPIPSQPPPRASPPLAKAAPHVTHVPHVPHAPAATKVATPPPMTNPREACSGRTQFALYRCMQTQCALSRWSEHPQCIRLRATDSVD